MKLSLECISNLTTPLQSHSMNYRFVTGMFRRSKPDPELIILVTLPARHGAAMGAKIQLKLSGFEIR
jgi:hypothetical protein